MVKSRFAIATHILTVLAHIKDGWVSSDLIAKSLNINPVLVRKEISNLKRNNLIICKEGKGGGSKLALPTSKITLGDIFNTIKENHVFAFAKNEPCPECYVGNQIKECLTPIFENVDQAVFNELNKTSLKEFSNNFCMEKDSKKIMN
ncbi:hypothetical protein UJ101_02097 [Flavobacteriaceae bacterium UJ101]|nr:hypothetical protein UJ101_02097 [Flavobacteriaceae bacterium UJ101]